MMKQGTDHTALGPGVPGTHGAFVLFWLPLGLVEGEAEHHEQGMACRKLKADGS